MDVFKWYGGKEKAIDAVMQSNGDPEKFKPLQDENDRIYRQFMTAKESKDPLLEKESVEQLAENYKARCKLDNARYILIDLAKEYQELEKLAEITDAVYGEGCAEYVANAIKKYYGI